MSTKLRVGNIGLAIDDGELKNVFSQVGTVVSAFVQVCNLSGKSRGFGFVEMGSLREAEACIQQLNGRDLGGREMSVAEAPPTPKRRGSR